MTGAAASWQLTGFGERIDSWKAREEPARDVVERVIRWSLTRLDDPYVGVKREPGFDNLWFGVVPGTLRGDIIVACSYWIFDRRRTVQCDGFASLSWPL